MRLLVVLLALPLGVARAEPKKKSEPVKAALHVRGMDRGRRVVTVEVSGGPQRAPAANLFTFTDDRGRHFVAVSAQCGEPFAPSTRSCELELPVGYERHRLVGIEVHLGTLKGRSLVALESEVAAAWDAATDSGASP